MSLTHVQSAAVGGVDIDYAAVLTALKLNPRDPAVQALVLTCERYRLDPVLGHMVLIQSQPYITHKGLLHVAHDSGHLDGIEVIDEGETQTHWWAKVSVYRDDKSRPFTYRGRYPKSGSNKAYGPEMAVTRAESMALRRAFDVSAPVQEEQDWQSDSPAGDGDRSNVVQLQPNGNDGPPRKPVENAVSDERRAQLLAAVEAMPEEAKKIAGHQAKNRKDADGNPMPVPNVRGPMFTEDDADDLERYIRSARVVAACTAAGLTSDAERHGLTRYVTGKESSKDLNDEEVQAVEEAAAKVPDRLAVVYEDDGTVSFSEQEDEPRGKAEQAAAK